MKKLRRIGNRWVAQEYSANGGGYACVGSLYYCLRFMLTGKRDLPLPFWVFYVEVGATWKSQSGIEIRDCSAGLFSKYAYIEMTQGMDICTGMFYRWLRIGIPRLGCWRIRLQKRWI